MVCQIPPEITVVALRFEALPTNGVNGAPTIAPLDVCTSLYLKKALVGFVGTVIKFVAAANAMFLNKVSLETTVADDESMRTRLNPGDLPVALMNLKRVNPVSDSLPKSSGTEKSVRVEPESANMVV